MAIATPLSELCRNLVQMMIDAKMRPDDGVSGQFFLEPQLYLPEIV
jgi:LacI family transcriptional regulator